ncbi:MAG: hypothetical protein K0S32_4337 [Bacteroidetes bacterium]|nr:hypothetical protein [Bacteroidota bacterium]
MQSLQDKIYRVLINSLVSFLLLFLIFYFAKGAIGKDPKNIGKFIIFLYACCLSGPLCLASILYHLFKRKIWPGIFVLTSFFYNSSLACALTGSAFNIEGFVFIFLMPLITTCMHVVVFLFFVLNHWKNKSEHKRLG